MRWSDLFRTKVPRVAADARLRWFGKLPTYGDYYRSNANEPWAEEFNDWVLKGWEVYQSRSASTPRARQRMPLCACALRLPKSRMTVFASILDYGGDMRGRSFPLCFYTAVPSAQWPGPTSHHLSGMARVIRDLIALRAEVAAFLNRPGSFEAYFDDRTIDLSGIDAQSTDDDWMDDAKNVRLADWFDGAKSGLNVGSTDELISLTTAWGDSIARFESQEFEPTLRFPLSASVEPGVQVAGWLRWLEARMDLGRRTLSLIVNGEIDNAGGRLSVIARDVIPDDFLLATPASSDLRYVDDLCAATPDKFAATDPVVAAEAARVAQASRSASEPESQIRNAPTSPAQTSGTAIAPVSQTSSPATAPVPQTSGCASESGPPTSRLATAPVPQTSRSASEPDPDTSSPATASATATPSPAPARPSANHLSWMEFTTRESALA